jgi:hypothetical protein
MSNVSSDREKGGTGSLTLDLDAFAWEALEGEASQMAVSIEELARFALLYYLADHDSGRTARRIPSRAAGDEERTLAELRAR